MRFRRALTAALILIGVAFGQTPPEAALKSKVRSIRYSPLAEAARVQEDVHLEVNSGVAAVLSGPPLLTRIAVDGTKEIGLILGRTDLDVTYHFALVDSDSVPTSVTVKRGNVLERAALRMFRMKTERVAIEYNCQERVPPPNDVKVTGAVIEVWIYGRTRCVMPDRAAYSLGE